MGSKGKRKKELKVKNAEITEDGCLIIEMNDKFKMGNTNKILFPPETIFSLGEEYASMPPPNTTDYPGIPVVEEEDVFSDDEEEPDQGEEEEGTDEDSE